MDLMNFNSSILSSNCSEGGYSSSVFMSMIGKSIFWNLLFLRLYSYLDICTTISAISSVRISLPFSKSSSDLLVIQSRCLRVVFIGPVKSSSRRYLTSPFVWYLSTTLSLSSLSLFQLKVERSLFFLSFR